LKNLIVRALTGIIFVAVIVSSIYFHPFSFLIVFSLIVALTLWEFYGLFEHFDSAPIKRMLYCLGGVYLFGATFVYANDLVDSRIFLPYILFLMFVLIAELYHKNQDPIRIWSLTMFGQFYCVGSFALLNFLASVPDRPDEIVYNPLFVLAIFVFVWLNDTGAYLFGSLFGKHRLFERISPKKSWEGFWGGFVVAVASSQIFALYSPEISRLNWMFFSVVIIVFGTWGDLVESLMKRTLEVKDSGHVLPGHGGMLDRFDSIILAIPAAYIYFRLFIQN